MYPVIAKFSETLGYNNVKQLCEQSLWTAVAFMAASVTAKVFLQEINLKSEVSFSIVSAVTSVLLYQNSKIKQLKKMMEKGDPLRADIMNIAFFIIFVMTPIVTARNIHNKFFQPFTYSQSFLRGAYQAVFGLSILYMYGVYSRQKKTLLEF